MILCWPRYLLSLCYALKYPFLSYGIIIWGNTYKTIPQPIFILQKKAMRIITFSRFDKHSSPLLKSLEIIKFLFSHLYVQINLLNKISLYPWRILPCHPLSWLLSCIMNLILSWVSSGVIGSLTPTLSPWKRIYREAHSLTM